MKMSSIRIKNRLFTKKYKVKNLPQFADKVDKAQYFDLVELIPMQR